MNDFFWGAMDDQEIEHFQSDLLGIHEVLRKNNKTHNNNGNGTSSVSIIPHQEEGTTNMILPPFTPSSTRYASCGNGNGNGNGFFASALSPSSSAICPSSLLHPGFSHPLLTSPFPLPSNSSSSVAYSSSFLSPSSCHPSASADINVNSGLLLPLIMNAASASSEGGRGRGRSCDPLYESFRGDDVGPNASNNSETTNAEVLSVERDERERENSCHSSNGGMMNGEPGTSAAMLRKLSFIEELVMFDNPLLSSSLSHSHHSPSFLESTTREGKESRGDIDLGIPSPYSILISPMNNNNSHPPLFTAGKGKGKSIQLSSFTSLLPNTTSSSADTVGDASAIPPSSVSSSLDELHHQLLFHSPLTDQEKEEGDDDGEEGCRVDEGDTMMVPSSVKKGITSMNQDDDQVSGNKREVGREYQENLRISTDYVDENRSHPATVMGISPDKNLIQRRKRKTTRRLLESGFRLDGPSQQQSHQQQQCSRQGDEYGDNDDEERVQMQYLSSQHHAYQHHGRGSSYYHHADYQLDPEEEGDCINDDYNNNDNDDDDDYEDEDDEIDFGYGSNNQQRRRVVTSSSGSKRRRRTMENRKRKGAQTQSNSSSYNHDSSFRYVYSNGGVIEPSPSPASHGPYSYPHQRQQRPRRHSTKRRNQNNDDFQHEEEHDEMVSNYDYENDKEQMIFSVGNAEEKLNYLIDCPTDPVGKV
jgi:hypothetical protein